MESYRLATSDQGWRGNRAEPAEIRDPTFYPTYIDSALQLFTVNILPVSLHSVIQQRCLKQRRPGQAAGSGKQALVRYQIEHQLPLRPPILQSEGIA